jgi:hypothetical protein
MSKLKYQATDSRGKVHTRTTTHRVYTHCVVAHIGARSVTEWAGRRELAENVARRWQQYQELRRGATQDVESVEILTAERVA